MNLLKSLAKISLMTLFSKTLGLTRDTIIARVFGIGMVTDAFFIAFKLTNMLRIIFSDGMFSQILIPILSEYKTNKGDSKTRDFIAYVTGLLTIVLLLISISGVLAAPWLVMITLPGFENTHEKFILTTELLRITFPYILFISLSSLCGSIFNTYNKFSIPTLSPILFNLTIIVFVQFLTPLFHPPIMGLAWSIVIGGILQLLYQLPFLKKIGMLIIPSLKFYNSEKSQVLRLMVPSIIIGSINQLSLVIINTIFSSFLISGSISWIYYADRLIEFPLGVLGVALNTIISPALSRSCSYDNKDEYCRLIDWGLRLCFILAIPSAFALIIIAKPLIIVLFKYGKFSDIDVLMTRNSLVSYSIGLVGLIIVKVLVPSFYSRQDIKTPFYISFITLVLIQLMNIIFIGPLKHVGLSLSIGLGACFNASLLFFQLYRKKLFYPQPGWGMFLIKVGLSVSVMSVVLFAILKVVPDFDTICILYRFFWIIGIVLLGTITYFFTLRALGIRIHNFFHFIKK